MNFFITKTKNSWIPWFVKIKSTKVYENSYLKVVLRFSNFFFLDKKTERKRLFNLLTFASLLLFSYSCQNDGKRNIKTYFYPFDEWAEGMVYEYHPVNNDALPVEYWYFRKLKTDTSTILTGQYYDQRFTPRQIFNANVEQNGIFVNDYILYEYDSLGNFNQNFAAILANNSFPFQINDSTQQFLLKLKWKMPTAEYPDAYLEMTRHRKFLGNAAYSFKNKSYECVEFQLDELMSDFNDGHLEKEFKGKELYAKNLGLIYYKKEIDENFVLEYELRDTFSMARFEQKFKNYLGE